MKNPCKSLVLNLGHLTHILFALQLLLPKWIWPLLCLHIIRTIHVAGTLGTTSQLLPASYPEHNQDFPRAVCFERA